MKFILAILAVFGVASCSSLKDAGYNVTGEICHEDYGCVSLDGDKNIKVQPKPIKGKDGKWSVKIDPQGK
ncbi:MAG: hypothetical protein GY811_05930 [Myxococcales bacterium]|nr:hypothetical protein [Myxococcales bacterium]